MAEIPAHVTAELNKHAESRGVYLGHVALCAELAANMARNRAGAEAAAASSAAAGAEWREEFRRTSGKITPKISKLKAESYQDKETAEELTEIIGEMNHELYERQCTAHDSRKDYLSVRATALKSYSDHLLTRATAQLLSTEAGQSFVEALRTSLGIKETEMASSPLFTTVNGQPMLGASNSTQRMFDETLKRNVNAAIGNIFFDAMKDAPAVADPVLSDLALLPRTGAEGKQEDTSFVKRQQRRHERTKKAMANP